MGLFTFVALITNLFVVTRAPLRARSVAHGIAGAADVYRMVVLRTIPS
jgi:hypothetical protein